MTSKDATAGGGTWYTHETQFNQHHLGGLKNMLDGANPQLVREIAQNWQDVHDLLVGPGGDAGIKKKFDDAVAKVLKTWHGKSADRFAEEASKISQNFQNGAPYAERVAQVMGTAAKELQKAVDEVTPLEEEWNFGDAFEDLHAFTMSDEDLDKLLKGGMSTEGVLKAYGGEGDAPDDLTDHQKVRLRAAVAMETLGAQYKASSASLPEPRASKEGRIHEQPEDPTGGQGTGGIAPVPMDVSQRPAGGTKMPSGAKGAGYSSLNPVATPRPNGIAGGIGTPKPGSQIGTGLDGLSGGTGGVGAGKTSGTGGLGGGLSGSAGGNGVGTGAVGMPGMPGGAAGVGGRAGAGAGRSGTGSGRAGAGRAGMPGMGGAAGGGAGAGRGTGGAGRGGSLARQAGGTVGAARGQTGGGAQGGSGLHRSRGGSQTGQGGSGSRGRGMMGMPGAQGANANTGKEQGGQRPDYLVEEEDTWLPERNVAPRVIE